jgi:hemerythrin superfamily protein
MGTIIKTGTDVVSFLKGQHEQVKALFEEVISATGKEREKAFFKLRRMLAVHETAEEEIVHPAARRALPEGEAIVRQRLHEEKMAKQDLSQIEKLDVDSDEFDGMIRKLQAAVVAHAEAEEREEFNALATMLEPERLERMRKAAEFAESVAPTHPHPGVESAAANILAGPFAAMIDRSRDAISGKSS